MFVQPRKTLIFAILATSAGVPSGAAQAQSLPWSVTGAGCVPTGQTAAGIGTFNSAGDAKFPAGRLGEIILTCPVPSSIARATGLAVTYRDTDGRGTAVRLRAALRQKVLETGAVSDVSGAVFDSNAFDAASANVRRSVQIANPCNGTVFQFDHSKFTYYVQVNMDKRIATQDVLLASVDLGSNVIC
jgi:hypothetical protein